MYLFFWCVLCACINSCVEAGELPQLLFFKNHQLFVKRWPLTGLELGNQRAQRIHPMSPLPAGIKAHLQSWAFISF